MIIPLKETLITISHQTKFAFCQLPRQAENKLAVQQLNMLDREREGKKIVFKAWMLNMDEWLVNNDDGSRLLTRSLVSKRFKSLNTRTCLYQGTDQ